VNDEGVAEEVDPEVHKQKDMHLDFVTVFKMHPRGPAVLQEVLDILHFFGAAVTPADMALQNAAKTILHHTGVWGDVEADRAAVVRRLLAS
jgi:hypothetical protein